MRRFLPALLVLAACGAGQEGPVVPAGVMDDPARIEEGKKLYADNCALCHGPSGDGHGTRHTHLTRPAADFTQPVFRERMPPPAVFTVIREGKRGTSMPAWRHFDEQQTWALVAYVHSLSKY